MVGWINFDAGRLDADDRLTDLCLSAIEFDPCHGVSLDYTSHATYFAELSGRRHGRSLGSPADDDHCQPPPCHRAITPLTRKVAGAALDRLACHLYTICHPPILWTRRRRPAANVSG